MRHSYLKRVVSVQPRTILPSWFRHWHDTVGPGVHMQGSAVPNHAYQYPNLSLYMLVRNAFDTTDYPRVLASHRYFPFDEVSLV